MKLHEIPCGTEIYARKRNEDVWIIHFTTEDKTYHAEQFFELDVPFGQIKKIAARTKNNDRCTVDIRSDKYLLVKDWDTEWEMLVRVDDVKKYVNLPKNDY